MPGPGKSRKSKKPQSQVASPSISASVSAQSYEESLGSFLNWEVMLDALCKTFQLPDLTSRNGLKKIHANFDDIYRKMENEYERNADNIRIRAGIVSIWTKMCIDALLRNKIFSKGVLDKLLPLLSQDQTRHVALLALSTMSHHGGPPIRAEIARKSSKTLVEIIQSFPDDERAAELSVATLAHTVSTVVDGGLKPQFPAVLKELDMAEILRSVIEASSRPYSPSDHRAIVAHAVELVSFSTMHASKSYSTYPGAVEFLVAGLRSRDWLVRSACLSGLLRLHQLGAEDDQRGFDPKVFISAGMRGLPNHLVDILMDYGHLKSETFLTAKAAADFQKAMMGYAQDQSRDLYNLGLKLVPIILKTEFSIADGMFEVEDPRTGRRTIESMGMPFVLWGDALPHCARAIREQGKPDEQDWADILEIKHHVMRGRVAAGVALAQKGLERNPEQGYFWYALTLSAESVLGLRAAKKGLKAKQLTPFCKWQMMQRAVTHAGDMGIRILQSEVPDEHNRRWEEAIAFLMSALEDAWEYLKGAPPDNRYVKNVCYWAVLLTVITREEDMTDLSAVQDILDKLKIAEEFSLFFGTTPPKTNLRLGMQTVVMHFASAIRKYGPLFKQYDSQKSQESLATPSSQRLEGDLEAWLERMTLEGGERIGADRPYCADRPEAVLVSLGDVSLYRCSWCGNPSAVLKKCSGCGKTRYCDAGCQRSHWSDHKKSCKAK